MAVANASTRALQPFLEVELLGPVWALRRGASPPCLVLTSRCSPLVLPTGRMMVLQPDPWHWFVAGEPDHPLLPPGPDVLLISDAPPSQQALPASSSSSSTASSASAQPCAHSKQHQAAEHAAEQHPHDKAKAASSSPAKAGAQPSAAAGSPATAPAKPQPQPQAAALAAKAGGTTSSSTATTSGRAAGARVARTTGEAVFALMDSPHPLDTLADPGAYLDKGR